MCAVCVQSARALQTALNQRCVTQRLVSVSAILTSMA